MKNFFSRFLIQHEEKKIPTLILGKDSSSYRPVALPITKYTRENHIIISTSTIQISNLLLRKYIKQDLKLEQAYQSNREIINEKFINRIDYVSGLIVIDSNPKFGEAVKLDALQLGIPSRDIYVFNPSASNNIRINLMSLPTYSVTEFILEIVKKDSDRSNIIQAKRSWIKRIVFLEKIYSQLTNKEPSINDLLEFFRNPTAIMDVLHFVEDNYNNSNNTIVENIKDLKKHFRLGDSLQNKVNFAIYDSIFKFNKDNALGRYLFDEAKTPVSLKQITDQGGLLIFDTKVQLFSETNNQLWSRLIRLCLNDALIDRDYHKAPQLPIYLIGSESYFDNNWLDLIKNTKLHNNPLTLQVNDLNNSLVANIDNVFSIFNVRSFLGGQHNTLQSIKEYFSIKKDYDFDNASNFINAIRSGTMITRLSDNQRNHIMLN